MKMFSEKQGVLDFAACPAKLFRRVARHGWYLFVIAALTTPRDVRSEEKDGLQLVGTVDAMIPFYSPEGGAPVAVVRVGRFWQDHERKGFFRIGMLPLLVADGVLVEVRDERQFRDVLANIQARFSSLKQSAPLELRHVEFRFPEELGPRLKADVVRFEPGGTWVLFGNVRFGIPEQSHQVHRAQLMVTGEEAGRLRLTTSGSHQVTNLFRSKQQRESKNSTRQTP
jgi:hypothetical protein